MGKHQAGGPNPKRSEALRRRWADPEQRARMVAGAAKGHEHTAAKLRGVQQPGSPPPDAPVTPPADAGAVPASPAAPSSSSSSSGRSAGGILRSLFAATPRDVVDRVRGK